MRLAQYHGVSEAARRVHDEHLSVGSFHLFRLPEEMEQDLHALLQAGGKASFFDGLWSGQDQMPLMNSGRSRVMPGLTLQGLSRSEGWRNSTVIFRQLPQCTDLHLILVSIRFPI